MIFPARILKAWTDLTFPQARFVTTTPASFDGILPVVKGTGVGGQQGLSLTSPRVDVEFFAGTELETQDFASSFHDSLVYAMRGLVGPASVTSVKCQSLPSLRTYPNPDVCRYGGIYVIYCH